MSRQPRHGKGEGAVPSAGINPFVRAHPPAGKGQPPTLTAASSPSPQPRVRNRKPKLGKVALAIAGAAARSRAKTRGNDEADDGEGRMRTSAAPAADVPLEQGIAPLPPPLDPTAEQAFEFARLLRGGVPQPDALAYVLGAVDDGVLARTLPRWLRARHVVDALATLNGGRWPALEPDKRLDIALDKHYAEMAHYLYTHDYESADGKEMRKLDSARESLERLRTGRMEQQSPFMRFLATLLKPKSETGTLPGPSAPTSGERPALMGFVDVEPAVDAEVTETVEGA